MKQSNLCCRFHNPNPDGRLETYVMQQIATHRVQQLLTAVRQENHSGGERSIAHICPEDPEC